MQKRWVPIFLFTSAFALYFFTRGIGLDDWDSVQFAMGTRQFDLWRHQPHPPGYPLLIFFARVLNGVFHSGPEFSLHLISCFGGALFISMWFLIARAYFGEPSALLLSISLAVTAIVWMTATRAISDASAAGLISVELYYTLRHRETGRRGALASAALFGAAAAGIRPQLSFVAAIILATNLGGRARMFSSSARSAGQAFGLYWRRRLELLLLRGPIRLAHSGLVHAGSWNFALVLVADHRRRRDCRRNHDLCHQIPKS